MNIIIMDKNNNIKHEKGIYDEGDIISKKDLLNDQTDDETEERYKYGGTTEKQQE